MQMTGYFLTVWILQCLLRWSSYNCFTFKMTRLTYYGDTVTWNTARSVCNQTGTRLLELQDETSQTAFLTFWRNLMHSETMVDDPWKFGFWLGLVYDESNFVWEGSSHLVTWNNWANDSYAADVIKPCVQVNHTTGLWNITDCLQPSFFVCKELTSYDCVLQRHHSKRIVLPENITLSVTLHVRLAYLPCLEECKATSLPNEWHCWAITVESNVTVLPPLCYIHIGPRARILDEAFLKNDNSHDVYMRQCYKVSYVDPGTITASSTSLPDYTFWSDMETSSTDDYSRTQVTLARTTRNTTSGYETTGWMSSTGTPDDLCRCSCPKWSNVQKQLFLDTILASLTINTSNLSSVRRKYLSAHDNRPTVQMLGYTGGVFLGIALLLIISCDIDLLFKGRRGDKSNLP